MGSTGAKQIGGGGSNSEGTSVRARFLNGEERNLTLSVQNMADLNGIDLSELYSTSERDIRRVIRQIEEEAEANFRNAEAPVAVDLRAQEERLKEGRLTKVDQVPVMASRNTEGVDYQEVSTTTGYAVKVDGDVYYLQKNPLGAGWAVNYKGMIASAQNAPLRTLPQAREQVVSYIRNNLKPLVDRLNENARRQGNYTVADVFDYINRNKGRVARRLVRQIQGLRP